MSKVQFKAILERYLQGTCTPQERALVEQWYELLDEDHRVLFPQLSLDDLEDELWEKVKERVSPPAQTPVLWYKGTAIKVAASIVVLFGLSFWIWQNQQAAYKPQITQIAQDHAHLAHYENDSQQPAQFQLPDGSVVTLSPKSAIDYTEDASKHTREALLSGEAFFQVKRNPEKPFLVYTQEIVTKVLGTSFWVKASNASSQVEVSVVTGKVSVFKNDAQADYISKTIKSGVILTPNQQVNYFPENKVFVTGIVKNPVLIQPEVSPNVANQFPSFKYDETSVAEVLSDLEKAYGIEIIVENEPLRACPLTADLSESNLYTKLDIICATLKATYEVRGTKILISGKGC